MNNGAVTENLLHGACNIVKSAIRSFSVGSWGYIFESLILRVKNNRETIFCRTSSAGYMGLFLYGTFCNRSFCKQTFCINGRFVNGPFVYGRFVNESLVGVPFYVVNNHEYR